MSLLITRIAAVLAAVAIALFVSSCSSPPAEDHPHPTDTDKPVVTGEPAGYNAEDVAFANNMISHDQQGIDMSALVRDRSTSPEVTAFAASSASANQSDVAILKVLLVQWYSNQDTEPGADRRGTPTTGMVDQATVAKLVALDGSEFDTLWLQSMIGLDQGAIEIANAEIAKGKNVDAVGLAGQIVETRQADIGQMKHILGS